MKPLRILLADDSAAVAEFIGKQLEGNGHAVSIVSSGEAAASAFIAGIYDLVLMDLEMPGRGGIDAIKQIRQAKRKTRVPIIVITAHSDEESLLDCFMAGADDVINKPVQALQLELRIQAMMRLIAEQRSTEALVESVIEGVIRIDRAGQIRGFNRAAEKIFGYSSEEVLGSNVKMLMPQPFRDAHDEYIGNYLATGTAKIIGVGREVVGLRKDGKQFPMQLGVTEVHSPDESYFVGLVRDLTLETDLKANLREGRRFLADLVENSGTSTFVKNKSGAYLLVNRTYEEVTGLARKEVIGKNDVELFGAEQASAYRAIDLKVMEEGRVIKTEEVLKREGETRYFLSIKFPTRDSDGTINGVCGMAADISEMKRIQADLERLSQHDELTGLFNRRHFNAMASREVARSNRYDEEMCVVMLDIDHFKQINDNYGHQVGDRVLQALGKVIKGAIRDGDLAGRMGGEEFALILIRSNESDGVLVAERLRQMLGNLTIELGNGKQLKITASLGLVAKTSELATFEQLLHQADLALYCSKNSGRNRVTLHKS